VGLLSILDLVHKLASWRSWRGLIFQALRGVAGGPPGEIWGGDFQTDNLKKSSKKEKAPFGSGSM